VIDRWLDVQDDEDEWLDTDAEPVLYGIAELVDGGASELENAAAVRCAPPGRMGLDTDLDLAWKRGAGSAGATARRVVAVDGSVCRRS
jgi:hypothetical protein